MGRKVVLDPGHGVETPGKRSPDGTYLEHEFALDMARRIQTLLERHGVEVVLTREDGHDVSLPQRVRISNAAAPDLFVSIHSNAAGSGGAWMGVRGYGIYTSLPGESAGRNKAAKAILARARAAGIHLWGGGLHHNSQLYVLCRTEAPAVLIEHLFHDNREDCALLTDGEYRAKLAEADARGILDYLGIPYSPSVGPEAGSSPEGGADEEKRGTADSSPEGGAVEKEHAGIVCPHCGGALALTKG